MMFDKNKDMISVKSIMSNNWSVGYFGAHEFILIDRIVSQVGICGRLL